MVPEGERTRLAFFFGIFVCLFLECGGGGCGCGCVYERGGYQFKWGDTQEELERGSGDDINIL